MNDPDPALDARIRRLIAEAGAQAPTARGGLPTEPSAYGGSTPSLATRRLFVAGVLSLATVLAIVAAVVIHRACQVVCVSGRVGLVRGRG